MTSYDITNPSSITSYDITNPSPMTSYDVTNPSSITSYDITNPSPMTSYDITNPSPMTSLTPQTCDECFGVSEQLHSLDDSTPSSPVPYLGTNTSTSGGSGLFRPIPDDDPLQGRRSVRDSVLPSIVDAVKQDGPGDGAWRACLPDLETANLRVI